MSAEIIALFVMLTTIIGTPGPNNFVLFSLGLKEGYQGALPTLLAINAGVVSTVMLAAIGADSIARLLPSLEQYFVWISFAILAFIAFRMWPRSSVKPKETTAIVKEQVLGLFFFQFVNPKIWVIAIGIITTFHAKLSWLVLATATLAVGLCFNSMWALAGRYVGTFSPVAESSVARLSSVLIFLVALYNLYSNIA